MSFWRARPSAQCLASPALPTQQSSPTHRFPERRYCCGWNQSHPFLHLPLPQPPLPELLKASNCSPYILFQLPELDPPNFQSNYPHGGLQSVPPPLGSSTMDTFCPLSCFRPFASSPGLSHLLISSTFSLLDSTLPASKFALASL